MEFREIIAGVEGARPTLALCNLDAPGRVLEAVGRYFEPRHVALRRTTTEHGVPKNVALLHDGEAFIAASDLQDLYRFVDPAVCLEIEDITALEVPAVVAELDDTTFSEYGKSRMILASREIEKRAWQAARGTLYAGFQRLSTVETQRRIYRKLGESDLEVHVYGLPDAEPPAFGGQVHGVEADEIARSWFVIFDGDGTDEHKCALLARETAETNTYRGFWTDRPGVVDSVIDRLESTYPT